MKDEELQKRIDELWALGKTARKGHRNYILWRWASITIGIIASAIASIIIYQTLEILNSNNFSLSDNFYTITAVLLLSIFLGYRIYSCVFYKKLNGNFETNSNLQFILWIIGLIVFIAISIIASTEIVFTDESSNFEKNFHYVTAIILIIVLTIVYNLKSK